MRIIISIVLVKLLRPTEFVKKMSSRAQLMVKMVRERQNQDTCFQQPNQHQQETEISKLKL